MVKFLARITRAGVMLTPVLSGGDTDELPQAVLLDNEGKCSLLTPIETEMLVQSNEDLHTSSTLCHAVLGVIRLLNCFGLVVAVTAEPVGTICGRQICKLTKTQILLTIPRRGFATLDEQEAKAQRGIMKMYSTLIDNHTFYFGIGYDLTGSAQQQAAANPAHTFPAPFGGKGGWTTCCRPEFCWNHAIAKPLIDAGLGFCVVPLVDGLVSFLNLTVPEQESAGKLSVIFISRRGCRRTGMRFRCRGADMYGNVANFIETEQIVIWNNIISSYVQVRGSIPLHWEQRADMFKSKLVLGDKTRYIATSCEKHFTDMVDRYGGVCTVINLINSTGDEGKLQKEFRRALRVMCETNPSLRGRIDYTHFDFHAVCKGNHYEQTSILLQKIKPAMAAMKYFLQIPDAEPVLLQQGIFRSNCVDCLDRTNVVQSVISRAVLDVQLRQLGIIAADMSVDSVPVLAAHLRSMWADHADYMSTQYTGSNALKTGFTRTGKQGVKGSVKDGINAAVRVVANQLQYTARELELNLFLGNYAVSRLDVARNQRRRSLSSTKTTRNVEIFTNVTLLERHSGQALPVALQLDVVKNVLSVCFPQMFLQQDLPLSTVVSMEPSVADFELLRIRTERNPFPLKFHFDSGLALKRLYQAYLTCKQNMLSEPLLPPKAVRIWCGTWNAKGHEKPVDAIDKWLEPDNDIYVVCAHNMTPERGDVSCDGLETPEDWWYTLMMYCKNTLHVEQVTNIENNASRIGVFARSALIPFISNIQTSNAKMVPFQLKSSTKRKEDSQRTQAAKVADDPQRVGAAVTFAVCDTSFCFFDVFFDANNKLHTWTQRSLHFRGDTDIDNNFQHLFIMGQPYTHQQLEQPTFSFSECMYGEWRTLLPLMEDTTVLYRALPGIEGISEIQPRCCQLPAPKEPSGEKSKKGAQLANPMSVSFLMAIPPPMVIPLETSRMSGYSLEISGLHAVLQAPDKADGVSNLSSLSTFLVFEAPFLEMRYSTCVHKKSSKPRWTNNIRASTFISDVNILRQQFIIVELWTDNGSVKLARGYLPLASVIPVVDVQPKQSLPPVPISVDLLCSGYVVGLLLGNLVVAYYGRDRSPSPVPPRARRSPVVSGLADPKSPAERSPSPTTTASAKGRSSPAISLTADPSTSKDRSPSPVAITRTGRSPSVSSVSSLSAPKPAPYRSLSPDANTRRSRSPSVSSLSEPKVSSGSASPTRKYSRPTRPPPVLPPGVTKACAPSATTTTTTTACASSAAAASVPKVKITLSEVNAERTTTAEESNVSLLPTSPTTFSPSLSPALSAEPAPVPSPIATNELERILFGDSDEVVASTQSLTTTITEEPSVSAQTTTTASPNFFDDVFSADCCQDPVMELTHKNPV